MRLEALASVHCDMSLGRRRLWVGNVISESGYCVRHEQASNDDSATEMEFSFLAVGDWGRDGMCCQGDVAVEMAGVAESSKPDFILSVGDNFYEQGLESEFDGQVQRSWKAVYVHPHKSLQREWKSILGNHDYLGDADAQVRLSKQEKFWHMPAKYFFETFANGRVFIAFLDTTCMYYSESEMTQFRGAGTKADYRERQIKALQDELKMTKAEWKIVITHHPFRSSGENAETEAKNQERLRETLAPILKQYGVVVLISGHEHLLEHFDLDGLQAFVTGAGSKVGLSTGRHENSLFSIGRQGFMQVALRKGRQELLVRFFDMGGSVVHTAHVKRPA